MFSDGSFYTSIVDSYYESVDGRLPLSVADMSQMNNLARATREVIKLVRANIGNGYADMHGIVHYANIYDKEFMPEYNIFYDAGDFIRHYAPEDAYLHWKETLDKMIIYKRMATKWKTCLKWNVFYTDFTMTAEKYHGVSMFVPQNPNSGDYKRLNENVKRMSWYVDICR